MNITLPRIGKAVIGILIVAVLLYVVTGWWSDYRKATQGPTTPVKRAPSESTKTTGTKRPAESKAATGSTEPKRKMVVVTTDGLNFRSEPNGPQIRGLDAGDKLTLIKEQDGWYQVEDANGKIGWVTSNSAYSRVE